MHRLQGTAPVAESVELAVVTRGDFVESRHSGHAVVLSPAGEVALSLGNIDAQFLTRSALKPLQSLAMHAQGLQLDSDEQRALSLASHRGSRSHATSVWQMLVGAGLTDRALRCPPDWPMGGKESREHIARGGKRERMLHCCSGKHAAMLRTCVHNGWDVGSYLQPDHPLQEAITETVHRFTGERPFITVDGCGAPTYGVTLLGFARAMRRMATSSPSSPFPLHRQAYDLLRAGREHAWAVCGAGSGDTTLMEQLGVFSKFGAEGSVVVITPEGYVVAVTLNDGAQRALHIVAAELLARVGALSNEQVANVRPHLGLRVSGGGAPVGEILVTAE